MVAPSTDAHIHVQLPAARALLKFCVDHKYGSRHLADIRQCIAALEARDMDAAVKAFESVPLGGNGCFNDWYPPAVFEHEDRDYVSTVFEALVSNWSLMMSLSVPKRSNLAPHRTPASGHR